MAAAALLLWQWSARARSRKAMMDMLALRIAAQNAPPEKVRGSWQPAPRMGADESPESMARRLSATPWLAEEAAPATGAAAGQAASPTATQGRASPTLPAWLLDAVSLRALGLSAAAILLVSALAGIVSGSLAAGGALVLLTMVLLFVVWLRVQRFRRVIVRQLPGFIDAMVRLITIGNSTQASFQMAIATTSNPLNAHLTRTASLVRAGIDLDRAMHQTATQVRIEELFLLASILGLGVRYGGRADLLLERVAHFMRDREQAEHELVAMSSETRLSAWVLGLLPVGVTAFIITVNPEYFMRMWLDATGRTMVFSAVVLQALGAFMLYRLTKL
ncbi:MAG: secretion system protein [Comamonadaceae bacterium]|nr:MAG: secretion system protein [Comamonadaceae bacterium]